MRYLLVFFFFLSGMTGLLFEITWVRWFTVLFGSTTRAAAAVLCAFFLGMALGNMWFGRRADDDENPALTYGKLEAGVAFGVIYVALMLQIFRFVYPLLYDVLTFVPGLLTMAKLSFAFLAIAPVTFLMGGTLPMVVRAVTSRRRGLGPLAGSAYALNTLGAVVGAILAGFFLPIAFGVRNMTLAAMGVNLLLFLVILALRKHFVRAEREPESRPTNTEKLRQETARREKKAKKKRRRRRPRPGERLGRPLMVVIAAVSGFSMLAVQVLWTRLFSLFYPNTVYNFAAILAVFLFGLSIGACLAAVVFKYLKKPAWVLVAALIVAGVGVLVSPELFFLFPAYKEFGRMTSWHTLHQAADCLLTVGGTILPAVVAAGLVLPLTWKIYGSGAQRRKTGQTVGLLTAANTGGVVAGTLLGGFVLVPVLGLSVSIQVVAWLYLVMAAVATYILIRNDYAQYVILILIVAPVVAAYILGYPQFSPFFIPPDLELVETYEGNTAHVAIAEKGDDRFILVNNCIKEGGTADADSQKLQGHLPLLLHSNPKKVAFIGVGTGITAGASLLHDKLERIVCIEISTDILKALPFFAKANNQLQEDPRVELVRDDGRNYLFGTRERFDVITCDLVQPYTAGTAYLFTREHFRTARKRLTDNGVYVHWLPMHQLSREDFESIARTFRSVFTNATVWRGPIAHERSDIMALVGTRGDQLPLDKDFLVARIEGLPKAIRDDCTHTFSPQMLGLLFAGELPAHPDFLRRPPLNLDDRPVLEYSAPVSAQHKRQFTGIPLYNFYRTLYLQNMAREDSLLSESMELAMLSKLALLIQKVHFPELVTDEDKLELQELAMKLGMQLAARQ